MKALATSSADLRANQSVTYWRRVDGVEALPPTWCWLHSWFQMQVRGGPLSPAQLKRLSEWIRNCSAQRQMIAVERVSEARAQNAGETSGSKALETRFANQACFMREQTSSKDACHP